MLKRILIFALFASISTNLFAVVSIEDLKEIRELTRTGKFSEALEKHLWFHEESKSYPRLGGVRLSYALTAWVELAKKYPPAYDALVGLRNDNKQALKAGSGSFGEFHDLASINEYLNDKEDTLNLFLFIHKNYPKQAKNYYHVVEDLLIEKKKYKICEYYLGDPTIKLKNLRYIRELDISTAKENPILNNPRFLKNTDDTYVDGVTKLIEVLVALNRTDEAKEIQLRALSYFSHDRIQQAIEN